MPVPFFELDFLAVGSASKSGDAIAIEYQTETMPTSAVHIVDGGYRDDGERLEAHCSKYYSNTRIEHVVATHGDRDHVAGLWYVVECMDVGTLWMLRPWMYAEALLPHFPRFTTVQGLERHLRSSYPHLNKLEGIALQRGIPISEPTQGEIIGTFEVAAPSRINFLRFVIEDDKKAVLADGLVNTLSNGFVKAAATLRDLFAEWGVETFPSDDTSPRNAMSVVQFADIGGKRILLTGDAGRSSLNEAADWLESRFGFLPRINWFQVPHHGSRHNVSSEVLNRWFGHPRSPLQRFNPPDFEAIVSAAEKDPDHPRKVVLRALMHRGANVVSTEGVGICAGHNSRYRDGWGPAKPLEYPSSEEEIDSGNLAA